MRLITVKIPETDLYHIDRLCSEIGITRSELIRSLLRAFIIAAMPIVGRKSYIVYVVAEDLKTGRRGYSIAVDRSKGERRTIKIYN